MLAAPLDPPKQEIVVCEAAVTVSAAEGCVIVNVIATVEELASVTVQVQVPAESPVTEVVPSPVGFPGVQLYEYGLVPPVGVLTLAAPFEPPLQLTLVCEAAVTLGVLEVTVKIGFEPEKFVPPGDIS